VAIFIHNNLAGLVRMWKISELYQAVWFTSMDQFLGYGRECFWGLCTLILTLPHVLMLRFFSCSRTCNTIFLRHKARAMILVGDFNAHLDNLPDHFSEGHAAMLSRFPELGTTRLGQYKDRANTAGRCLRDIALEISLILTTGRGVGDNGQPTFFGYNPPFYPSRTEHLLMSTALFPATNKSACYMNLTQQTTSHLFAASQASVRYHTLICGFQVRL